LAAPPLGCHTPADLDGSGDLRHDAKADSIAVIQFSSGTTVAPKPVALTHSNLLSNVAAIDQFFEVNGGARTGVSWLPLYHDMGLVGALLEALYHPGDLVLIPPEIFLARPALWLRALSRHRADVSPAPNFAYGLCLKKVRDEDLVGVDLSSWRFALNGAEPVNPAVLRRFSDRFGAVGFQATSQMPVYGLSEATLAVTFHTRGQPLHVQHIDALSAALRSEVTDGTREVVAVGKPLAGVDVEIRSEQGESLPDRRIGRIFVRSPGVMHGYFALPDATETAVPNGWLDTGDLGFTLDGSLFISGRAKDVIILRGANHPPQAFEECLEGAPGLRTGCAVALGFAPEEEAGEELAILAEVEKETDISAELVEQVRGRVAAATGIRPHTILLLLPGTLPRTSSGKLRRGEARKQWLSGELRPPRSMNAVSVAWEMAKGQLQHLRATTLP
jgi:acyl-CoA synthetase (AMP-forming)/AMP-acid ligase II